MLRRRQLLPSSRRQLGLAWPLSNLFGARPAIEEEELLSLPARFAFPRACVSLWRSELVFPGWVASFEEYILYNTTVQVDEVTCEHFGEKAELKSMF